MRCEEFRARMGEGGEEIRRHAASCPECARAVAEQGRVDHLLGRWQVDAASVDVWPAVRTQLPRARAGRGWMLAAAATIVGAVVLVQLARTGKEKGPEAKPPGGEPVTASAPPPFVAVDDACIARHAELAAAPASPRAGRVYAYRAGYDEALGRGDYDAWAIQACSAAGASGAPAWLPRGSTLQKNDVRDGRAEALWWTPMGDVTVMESREASGRAGLQTVVRGGRETKLARFVKGGVEVTVVSEALPWPAMESIRNGYSK